MAGQPARIKAVGAVWRRSFAGHYDVNEIQHRPCTCAQASHLPNCCWCCWWCCCHYSCGTHVAVVATSSLPVARCPLSAHFALISSQLCMQKCNVLLVFSLVVVLIFVFCLCRLAFYCVLYIGVSHVCTLPLTLTNFCQKQRWLICQICKNVFRTCHL